MTTRSLQESVFRLAAARWAIAAIFLCRGTLRLRRGKLYRGLDDLCWIMRVSNVAPLMRIARRIISATVNEIRSTGRNHLVASYLSDPASAACEASYALSGHGGPHDLFRDLVVLKKATADEKGVILLKYVRTFYAVVSMFDLTRLMERYTFVLEPCWAGYCDPSILMFLDPKHPVFVQCFTKDDYQFVADVGAPLVPLKLGPADWVDADLFKPSPTGAKPYDLVMVANFARHKRHAQLFRALEGIRDRNVRVLLIGFPWAGRTADHVRREAAAIANDRIHVDVIQSVPPAEVARYVSQCKAFVFLSRKEGDNKALVEAMFVDVPAIVYDKTIGGAGSRINSATGIFASDADLTGKILYMLDHYRDFTPRAWVREHSGSAIATRVLNDAIRRTVVAAGGTYTEGIVEKTNSPNLTYKDRSCRARFQPDYDFIIACRRDAPAIRQDAVA